MVQWPYHAWLLNLYDIRLKTALAKDIITEEAYQAFYLVKSVLIGVVDSDCIFPRNLSGRGGFLSYSMTANASRYST